MGCTETDAHKNRFNKINSVSLRDKNNTSFSLQDKQLTSFKKDLSQLEEINEIIFLKCYDFLFKTMDNETIVVETDGNVLKINRKYFYSKDNLITKYFNVLEENFCRDTSEKLISIIIIKQIFDSYTEFQESTDSENNKIKMSEAIQNIDVVDKDEDLELLINVWMYYDPTDFDGRNLIFKVFKKNKEKSVKAIQDRIKNKKEWEVNEIAPYSELFELLNQVQKL